MSAGRTHVSASLILASGFSLGAVYSLEPRLLICAFGALAGTIISPDLDVDKAFIGDKIVEKRVGWFGKRIWLWFWRPYKTSFSHGRFASHFPIFSTFMRLVYIYFLTILPFYGFYFLMLHSHYYQDWLMNELYYWVAVLFNPWFFYGLASSDTVHYFLDKLTRNME